MREDSEAAELVGHAAALARQLTRLGYSPRGETSHSWHMEWLDRADLLGRQLHATLALEAIGSYPAAFAAIRTALEHHLVDRLIVLGHVWQQANTVPQPHDPDGYEASLRTAQAEGTVVSYQRTSARRFLVVRQAPHFASDPDQWLSVYGEWAKLYDPFRGPPNVQDKLIGVFMDPEQRKRLAKEAQSLRQRVFDYRSLREHLDLNHLLDGEAAAQLDVHYAWLSAFTHPTAAGYDTVLGHSKPRSGGFDHYCSELVAAYVCRLACLELVTLLEGFSRKPVCGVAGAVELRKLIDQTEERIDFFWFLGGSPTEYDRVMTANYLTFRTRDGHGHYSRVYDPDWLSRDEIGLLPSPLARHIGLHSSFKEITTGIGWTSPWQRPEARTRRA